MTKYEGNQLIFEPFCTRVSYNYTGDKMFWYYFYFIWLIVISCITFGLYGFDKSRARTGGWRVPEKYLHWLALLGGFPGGWIGRSVFRHKTQKGIFLFVLAVSTIIHAGIIYWLFRQCIF